MKQQLTLPFAEVNLRYQGIISAKVFNGAGEVVREVEEFTNLITDAGLDTLMQDTGGTFGTAQFDVCKVGTGAGVPANSDTVIPGGIANTATMTVSATANTTTAPYYIEETRVFTFGLGWINATLTAIGMGTTTNNTEIKCWSQIKDSDGNVTTLTVLADEQLQVTYKLRLYAPAFPIAGTVTITNAGTYNYNIYYYDFGTSWTVSGTTQPFNVSTTAYAAVTWTTMTPPANITGTVAFTGRSASSPTTVTLATYVAGTFYRDLNYQWPISGGNLAGGIKGLQLSGAAQRTPYFLIDFGGTIPKDNTKILNLTLRFSVARYP